MADYTRATGEPELELSNCVVTNNNAGDLWVDTDEGSTLVFNGSDWEATKMGEDTRLDRMERLVEQIADRLAILDDPSPEKLEQFETLKDAYNKYKFVDGLCGPEEEKE